MPGKLQVDLLFRRQSSPVASIFTSVFRRHLVVAQPLTKNGPLVGLTCRRSLRHLFSTSLMNASLHVLIPLCAHCDGVATTISPTRSTSASHKLARNLTSVPTQTEKLNPLRTIVFFGRLHSTATALTSSFPVNCLACTIHGLVSQMSCALVLWCRLGVK